MFDWALVSCAAAAQGGGRRHSPARVALGAFRNVPHQVQAANDFLEGKRLDEAIGCQGRGPHPGEGPRSLAERLQSAAGARTHQTGAVAVGLMGFGDG